MKKQEKILLGFFFDFILFESNTNFFFCFLFLG